MTTLAQVMEAERLCRVQRQSFAHLLRIDPSKVTPDELEICEKIKAAASGDQAKYEAILQHGQVGDFFATGALYFERIK